MALEVLTNERDKHGNLIKQLIVSDQEESHYRKIAREEFIALQKAEYKAMGLPFGTDEADERRAKIFRSIVFFHSVGRWVLLTIATLAGTMIIDNLLDRIEIGWRPPKQ